MKRLQLNMFRIFLIIAFMTAFSGCSTKTKLLRPQEEIKRSVSESGINITFTFLPEKSLKKRYGTVNNPFISPPSIMGLNKILAMELLIEIEKSSESALKQGVIIPLGEIKLSIEGKTITPTNRFHLTEFWENKIRHQTEMVGMDLAKIRLIIKREVVPNSIEVSSGSSLRGLVVFMGSFDIYSQKNVVFPVYDGSGNFLKNFDFTF